MKIKRLPTMRSSLGALINEGLKITTVLDVGVLKGTDYLCEMFPQAFHHLFEPISDFVDDIAANYSQIPHLLHEVALSSENGLSHQVSISRDGSGKPTHSFLNDDPISIGDAFLGSQVISCKPVKKCLFDDYVSILNSGSSYLVKIDVDGHELDIINGGKTIISSADIVIIEATMSTLIDRALRIRELGHQLIDIVDLCYYHDMLSQVDLIFASDSLLKRSPGIRPWGNKIFTTDAWITLNHQLLTLNRSN